MQRLYRPSEIQLLVFTNSNEKRLSGEEILIRAKKMEALRGDEQFQALWDLRREFPKAWKGFWCLVPATGRWANIILWRSGAKCWHKGSTMLDGSSFFDVSLYRFFGPLPE